MLARFRGTAAGKRLVEHLMIRNHMLLRPSPVGQRGAAGSAHLKSKQLDHSFVNPVIVRLYNALTLLVDEAEQALLFDRRPDQRIDVGIAHLPQTSLQLSLPHMTADLASLEDHRPALTGHCYRMLGSVFDADDAVQETMLRAWKAWEQFDGRSSVRTWHYSIATNVCLDE